MPTIILQKEKRCSGCGRCIAICRQKVFSIELEGTRKMVRIVAPEQCDYCGKCEENCTTGIIVVKEKCDVPGST